MKKKYLICILILIIIIPLFLIIYPITKNNKYQKDLIKDIYNNTNIKEIKYLNKDNNYYIIKTKDKVIVLDLNYEEVYNIDLSLLQSSNLELVYRRNNLYYEEKIREKNKITYQFYDVETNDFVYETSLGGA